MKSILLSALLLGSMLAGCASGPQDAVDPQASRGELTFRTGSNIPVRDKPMSKEDKEKQTEESRRALDDLQTIRGGALKTN